MGGGHPSRWSMLQSMGSRISACTRMDGSNGVKASRSSLKSDYELISYKNLLVIQSLFWYNDVREPEQTEAEQLPRAHPPQTNQLTVQSESQGEDRSPDHRVGVEFSQWAHFEKVSREELAAEWLEKWLAAAGFTAESVGQSIEMQCRVLPVSAQQSVTGWY